MDKSKYFANDSKETEFEFEFEVLSDGQNYDEDVLFGRCPPSARCKDISVEHKI